MLFNDPPHHLGEPEMLFDDPPHPTALNSARWFAYSTCVSSWGRPSVNTDRKCAILPHRWSDGGRPRSVGSSFRLAR
jgi:hypothetical protein